jgi:hypothetical protein
MHSNSYAQILERIRVALEASRTVFAGFTPGAVETEYKAGDDPVTKAESRAGRGSAQRTCARRGRQALGRECGRPGSTAVHARLGGRSARRHSRIRHVNSGILRFDRVRREQPSGGGWNLQSGN